MPSPRLLLVLVPVLALAGCSLEDDGPSATQTRDVAVFTRVDNPTAVDVRLTAGEPQRVQVRAGNKVIDDVHTEVRDGTLHITFDHHGWGGSDVLVEASVPRLTAIRADGSGNVEATGIDADAFELHSEGSGDIAVTGRARRLTLDHDGSGDTDVSGLAARDAHVNSDGSGDVELRADRLDVSVDGSGNVRYHGHPQLVRRRVDGSADLSPVN